MLVSTINRMIKSPGNVRKRESDSIGDFQYGIFQREKGAFSRFIRFLDI
jgi:hypothetical protein